MERLDSSEAVPILLIADNDVRRREELRHFFFNSGFLVASASNGLECLAEVAALEADVLVIALEIPWGGGDGVIARMNDGLPTGRKPLISSLATRLRIRSPREPAWHCAIASRSPFAKRICLTVLAWNPPSDCCAVQKIGDGLRKKV